jgi:ribosome-associated translation inhibitor RaiA
MYLSIDAAIEKVLTQLRRRAEKGQAHKAVGLGRTESIVAKDETQPEL